MRRLAQVLHGVHALPGMEGACAAESAVRAWAAAETGDASASPATSNHSSNSMAVLSPGSSPSIPGYVPGSLALGGRSLLFLLTCCSFTLLFLLAGGGFPLLHLLARAAPRLQEPMFHCIAHRAVGRQGGQQQHHAA